MLKDYKVMNYKEYIKTAEEEELQFIDELYDQGKLLDKGLEEINNINENLRVLVITATRCKDSATIVPFLQKMAEINPKIEVGFLLKKDAEDLLKELSGEMKVPSFMLLNDEGDVVRKFIEFPVGVKDILIKNPPEKTQDIIDDMRAGKYNELVQKGLIEFLTGNNYEYKQFERKDK